LLGKTIEQINTRAFVGEALSGAKGFEEDGLYWNVKGIDGLNQAIDNGNSNATRDYLSFMMETMVAEGYDVSDLGIGLTNTTDLSLLPDDMILDLGRQVL
jgi:hypothetical protein